MSSLDSRPNVEQYIYFFLDRFSWAYFDTLSRYRVEYFYTFQQVGLFSSSFSSVLRANAAFSLACRWARRSIPKLETQCSSSCTMMVSCATTLKWNKDLPNNWISIQDNFSISRSVYFKIERKIAFLPNGTFQLFAPRFIKKTWPHRLITMRSPTLQAYLLASDQLNLHPRPHFDRPRH